jgi:hypothetical protein
MSLGLQSITAFRATDTRPLDERDKVVLADALEHEERCRGAPAIGDQVRATRLDGVRVTGE